ncbi:MAG: haloacid dehalogenase type II, partial [Alphaproteobacteria bacterium]
MRLSDFDVLTFDTFGTLIDWEAGLTAALAPLLARLSDPPGRDDVLEQFAAAETAAETAHPAMRYADLLALVHTRLAEQWGVAPAADEAAAFGRSVGSWPAFADAAEALAALKPHFTLITLTNCDRASYRGSAARLGEPWDAIYTAEDVGAYKPDQRNFDYLTTHVEIDFKRPKTAIMHVAQSLYHDHVPATRAGLRTTWIDRRHAAAGHGAT